MNLYSYSGDVVVRNATASIDIEYGRIDGTSYYFIRIPKYTVDGLSMNLVTVLMVLPLLVALTNMITNVVKGLCALFANNAKLVATVVAEALTLLATAAYLEIFSIQATWYWCAGGAVVGAVVAYVAMNGYDGLYEDLIKHLKGLGGSQ